MKKSQRTLFPLSRGMIPEIALKCCGGPACLPFPGARVPLAACSQCFRETSPATRGQAASATPAEVLFGLALVEFDEAEDILPD